MATFLEHFPLDLVLPPPDRGVGQGRQAGQGEKYELYAQGETEELGKPVGFNLGYSAILPGQ